jgi:hypothetical protein
MSKACSVKGCDHKYYARGWCDMHYQRNQKYGSPHGGKRNHASLEERFWRYVDKRGPDECWLWTASRVAPLGYGQIQTGGKGSPRTGAHRVSFKLANGFDPPIVMHTCDNPPCVNPAHLKAGTHAENSADMVSKGRWNGNRRCGLDCPNAKLDPDKVREIRAHPEISHAEFARRFEVGTTVIRSVRSGKTWKHIE